MQQLLNNDIRDMAKAFCNSFAHCSDCPVAASPEGCPMKTLMRFNPAEIQSAIEILQDWAENKQS